MIDENWIVSLEIVLGRENRTINEDEKKNEIKKIGKYKTNVVDPIWRRKALEGWKLILKNLIKSNKFNDKSIFKLNLTKT